MPRKSPISDKKLQSVIEKLQTICKYQTRQQLTAELQISKNSVSNIVNGYHIPSEELANVILAYKVRKKSREKIVAPKVVTPKESTPKVIREKVKKAPLDVIPLRSYLKAELLLQNDARAVWGLPLLTIKVYNCLFCNKKFESTGFRTCPKCRPENMPVLSGQEITQ
jgi:hypothetical protein